MKKYYVNKNAQPTGEHEVHKSGCAWMPRLENCLYLGEFYDGKAAVAKAKTIYPNSDGCKHCCPEAHTK
jgi:phage-related protein